MELPCLENRDCDSITVYTQFKPHQWHHFSENVPDQKITLKTLKLLKLWIHFSLLFNKLSNEEYPSWKILMYRGLMFILQHEIICQEKENIKNTRTLCRCAVPVYSSVKGRQAVLLLSWLSWSTLSCCEGCLCLSSTKEPQHCSSTLNDVNEFQWLFYALPPVEWWVWIRQTTNFTFLWECCKQSLKMR